MRSTLFGITAGSRRLLFDSFSMTNVGIWDLTKRRTDYEGPAVRVALAADSGATTLDIGFNADGSFDMDAYEAFGTGSERVITWYDQSGNGWDFSRAWNATLCPIIRTSAYNSKPCVYFNGTGSLGNAAFTDWNGKADVNLVVVTRPMAQIVGDIISGGAAATFTLYAGYSGAYIFENSWSALNQFENVWERLESGMLYRVKYDGGASAADRLTLYVNNQVITESILGDNPGSTWSNKTGIYINAQSNGTSGAKDNEYFGAYYFGRDIDVDWATIRAGVVADYFTFTSSQFIVAGDSMTVSYALNGTDPTNTYPEQLERLLETSTGRVWEHPNVTSTAEIAAPVWRTRQLGTVNAYFRLDDFQQERIAVLWAGTNNLAYEATITAKNFTADAGTNVCTSATHGLLNGLNVRVSSSGTLPAGLSAATDYTVQAIDGDTFKLFADFDDLITNFPVDITDAGTGTHTFTPTPSATNALNGSASLAQYYLDNEVTKVYYLNMLPRTDLAGGNAAFETARGSYNSGLAAALPVGVEVIDVAGIAELQDSDDTNYYLDAVHLVLAGYTLIADAVRDAIVADL